MGVLLWEGKLSLLGYGNGGIAIWKCPAILCPTGVYGSA